VEKRRELTIAGPAYAGRTDLGTLFIDFEPDIATSIPVCCRLAVRHLGQVELEGAGVADAALGGEADGVTRFDFIGLGAGAGGKLVAADGVGVDVSDGAVGLVVCCLADVGPLTGLWDMLEGRLMDLERICTYTSSTND
jgi:hypothetical protein